MSFPCSYFLSTEESQQSRHLYRWVLSQTMRLLSCNWVFYHHCLEILHLSSCAAHLHLNQSDSICTAFVLRYFIYGFWTTMSSLHVDILYAHWCSSFWVCMFIDDLCCNQLNPSSLHRNASEMHFRDIRKKPIEFFSPLLSSRQEAQLIHLTGTAA